ncbi:hypothetical protein DLJ53_02075 [Acuticoccus sediminis]|uniref:Uncharacterized protein n=1 Tax=Acuticoccus sediminis TaxID=2184697 RepID=A0A8B2NSZ4_9HYPH|nr:hypothetical protein [Acuticoccus sediminis]RAI03328.1 hypothetical protein DLJ53_02075 [Acuticoccus sediminis]
MLRTLTAATLILAAVSGPALADPDNRMLGSSWINHPDGSRTHVITNAQFSTALDFNSYNQRIGSRRFSGYNNRHEHKELVNRLRRPGDRVIFGF